MNGRIINEGDYILITDSSDDFYLRIGEVRSCLQHYEIENYEVKFHDSLKDEFVHVTYGHDLLDKCKVLSFV